MGDMSEKCTLLTWSGVERRWECGWGVVAGLLGVLFTFSTDDTCAVGMVLCAVCTLCSVFTLFTVFAVMILRGVVCRAMYSCVNIGCELGGVYHVGWRVGRLCPRGMFRTIGDMRHRSS